LARDGSARQVDYQWMGGDIVFSAKGSDGDVSHYEFSLA